MIMVCKAPSILVIDDDEAITSFVCDGLSEEGCQCEFVTSAEDALSKLRRHCFDVVLLDIKLPGKSGMDLLKSSEVDFQTTTIVMMTAIKDLEIVVKAMQLGASDYIVKPFTVDKLSAIIMDALRNRKCSSRIIDSSLRNIDAIASGVDAQIDYFDFHSQMVIERTVSLARQLGFSDGDIDKWTELSKGNYSKRTKILDKSESQGNPVLRRLY
jgi:DNA-binding response OmpR family regulator